MRLPCRLHRHPETGNKTQSVLTYTMSQVRALFGEPKEKTTPMGVFHKTDFTCRKAKGVLTICPYSFFILSGGNIALSIFLNKHCFCVHKSKLYTLFVKWTNSQFYDIIL